MSKKKKEGEIFNFTNPLRFTTKDIGWVFGAKLERAGCLKAYSTEASCTSWQ